MKKKKDRFDISQVKRRSKSLILLAKKFRKELVDNQTIAEKQFKKYLKLLGLKFEFQKIIYAGESFYIVDFYLPRSKIAIEIDGGYHKDRIDLDNERTYQLILSGINGVVRFNNKEVFEEDRCIKKIKDLIL